MKKEDSFTILCPSVANIGEGIYSVENSNNKKIVFKGTAKECSDYIDSKSKTKEVKKSKETDKFNSFFGEVIFLDT